MKILYLAYYFPPTRAVAGRRFRQFVEGTFRGADAQYAITNEARADDALPVNVHSVEGRDIRDILTRPAGEGQPGTGGRMRKFILSLRQAFPFVYLTDDGGPQYRRRAYRLACRLIEEERITHLLSSFRPWSDHLVARRLKRRFPHLHWIADFRDLPVDPVRRDLWFPALQTFWGRSVIAGADEMWCVSRGQRAQFREWHPTLKVVRNALRALPPALSAPPTDRFVITYTGSLYAGLQSVDPLLTGLRKLLANGTVPVRALLLRYRGKDAALFRSWTRGLPPECLDIAPSIAPASAQKLQAGATLLLLLNWSAPGYYGVLTAKLWDYLAAGRPILALVNGPGDEELQEVISGADAGAVFGEGEQGKLDRWLTRAYREWEERGTVAARPNLDYLRQLGGIFAADR